MARYCSEAETQKLLRKWVYKHYDNQARAAKKLGTSACYLGHVLNDRKTPTKRMLRVLGLEKEVIVRYKRVM